MEPIIVSLTFRIRIPPKLTVLDYFKGKHERRCMSRHTFPSNVKILGSYLFDFALRDFFFIFSLQTSSGKVIYMC